MLLIHIYIYRLFIVLFILKIFNKNNRFAWDYWSCKQKMLKIEIENEVVFYKIDKIGEY
jgi:hypothetical protein